MITPAGTAPAVDGREIAPMPALLPCPLCSGRRVPSIVRGRRAGKFFLVAEPPCTHVWAVVDYRSPAKTELEARERWNVWARANGAGDGQGKDS